MPRSSTGSGRGRTGRQGKRRTGRGKSKASRPSRHPTPHQSRSPHPRRRERWTPRRCPAPAPPGHQLIGSEPPAEVEGEDMRVRSPIERPPAQPVAGTLRRASPLRREASPGAAPGGHSVGAGGSARAPRSGSWKRKLDAASASLLLGAWPDPLPRGAPASVARAGLRAGRRGPPGHHNPVLLDEGLLRRPRPPTRGLRRQVRHRGPRRLEGLGGCQQRVSGSGDLHAEPRVERNQNR